jgi:metallo-beta-lactamase class B
MNSIGRVVRIVIAVVALAGPAYAQQQIPADWIEPFPPFRIADNLYYVGSKGLANYLITTPQGHILINSDLEASVPLIRASIEKLGFKFRDVKVLLINQSHWDHAAGSAAIKKLTGARYMVMDADAPVVQSGGKTDFHYGGDASTHYPPTTVDRILKDGDRVTLGDVVLTAHLTPGHTKGCTTWTMQVKVDGQSRNVVIIGGTAVNSGFKLFNNAQYPNIVKDYERAFAVLKSLPCDIPLGAHGSYFGLDAKYQKASKGDATAFIDPDGYKKNVASAEKDFLTELARQKAVQAR